MASEIRRRTRSLPRAFMLHQIVPMRPYLFRIMADLRLATKRELESAQQLHACPAASDYQQRRTRYEMERQLQRTQERVAACRHELEALGAIVGEVEVGEMLFPCLVNDHDAFFVWFDSQQRPTHWQFADETELRCIPRRWWASERSRQRIGKGK